MIDPETLFEKHKSTHLGFVSNFLNNFIVSSPPQISRAFTILDKDLDISSSCPYLINLNLFFKEAKFFFLGYN